MSSLVMTVGQLMCDKWWRKNSFAGRFDTGTFQVQSNVYHRHCVIQCSYSSHFGYYIFSHSCNANIHSFAPTYLVCSCLSLMIWIIVFGGMSRMRNIIFQMNNIIWNQSFKTQCYIQCSPSKHIINPGTSFHIDDLKHACCFNDSCVNKVVTYV